MERKILIYLILWLIPSIAISQEHHLGLIANPKKDSIMLRWGATDPEYWQLGNSYGYKVVRYTISRDRTLLEDTEMRVLTPEAIKPLKLEQWEDIVEKDPLAAIAAQAIYGEGFEITTGDGTDTSVITEIYRESMLGSARFSSSLFVADISPLTARASGLSFTDYETISGEEYLYRVFLDLPDTLASAGDTASILAGTDFYEPLPEPAEFNVEYGNNIAILSWNSFVHNNIYIAWQPQRSYDGKTFEDISDNLTVTMTSEDNPVNETSYKMDSISDNIRVYYRIRGITSFGERGPWSPHKNGVAETSFNTTPNISGHSGTEQGIKIDWEFPPEEENLIDGFRVLRSGDHNEGYGELSTIKGDRRSYTDRSPLPTNYYKIEAIGRENRQSYPYLVQLPDDLPPSVPTGLYGEADSLGVVRLYWEVNREEDLQGYIVLRSPSGNDEYIRITSAPINDNKFIDTLNEKDFNGTVYYKIAAIDNRQNISPLSPPIEIDKTDIIAPSQPAISSVDVTEEGAHIVWINSSSEDVVRYEIYRKQFYGTVWKFIHETVPNVSDLSFYVDTQCPVDSYMIYRVTAVDRSGNRSDSPSSIIVKGMGKTKKVNMQKINGKIDHANGRVLLDWVPPEGEIDIIRIYRRSGEEPYSVYCTLEGKDESFIDNGLKAGEEYGYRLKLVFTDGSVSGFSDEILIEY